MKNISFICLLFGLTILGCDKEKSGTPKSGNGYYMFSITIDGVTHKVEGNYGNSYQWSLDTENRCFTLYTPDNEATIVAELNDKGAASYIEGEKFTLLLMFPNLIGLGVNNSILEDYQGLVKPNDLNWPASFCSDGQPNVFITNNEEAFTVTIDNFIITDLGSAPDNPAPSNSFTFTYGDPVIGSFSGTIFGCSNHSIPDVLDTPIQLEIEFVAPRTF